MSHGFDPASGEFNLDEEMESVTSSEAREKLADIIGKAEHAKVRTAITKHGRAVAMVVPIEDLLLLQAIEDSLDHQRALEILRDPDNQKDRVSHAEMKRRLGLLR